MCFTGKAVSHSIAAADKFTRESPESLHRDFSCCFAFSSTKHHRLTAQALISVRSNVFSTLWSKHTLCSYIAVLDINWIYQGYQSWIWWVDLFTPLKTAKNSQGSSIQISCLAKQRRFTNLSSTTFATSSMWFLGRSADRLLFVPVHFAFVVVLSAKHWCVGCCSCNTG